MEKFLSFKKAAVLIAVFVAFLTGFFIGNSLNQSKNEEEILTKKRSELLYLSPRIFLEDQNDILLRFVDLRANLQEYVKKNSANNLGMYFEYLPSGVSIGINEKEEYILASLLKVPLVMAVYKQVEEGKLNLGEEVKVEAKHIDSTFGNLWRKGAGYSLTLREAIRLTLQESDNTAKNALFDIVPPGSIEDVFDNLDIPKIRVGEFAAATPKNYSSILRSLYLSSYLGESSSNDILQILTETIFNDKLPAGVPEDIKIAHKIGVYDLPNTTTPILESVYTDCGIVYVPKRPYILCMMTRSPEDTAKKYMSEISQMIYKYVSTSNHLRKN